MIVAAFISRDDDWILPHKLRVYSQFCDRVFVLLDRSPQSALICDRFAKVECRHYESADYPMGDDGPRWDEGAMRQAVWDWAVECGPSYVVLGDTDEIPTPAIAWWLLDGMGSDAGVQCWYADWVNLIHDAGHAIGGASAWSYQRTDNNKKGLVVKYDPAREYRYRLGTRHVRMEPSPLSENSTRHDNEHRIGPVPLVHYRWANWSRWCASEMSGLPAYQPWPPADSKIVEVPLHMLWRWDADKLIESLPDDVAVVGNGPCFGKGEQIDSHKCVIRFNNWNTDGNESDIGSRTDVWCTNTWDDVAMRDWSGDMLTVTTHDEDAARSNRWLGAYPHMHAPKVSWTDAARALKPIKPSTGLVLLHRLAQTNKRITAYGFDGLVGGHYGNPQHEHDHPQESRALASLGASVVFA